MGTATNEQHRTSADQARGTSSVVDCRDAGADRVGVPRVPVRLRNGSSDVFTAVMVVIGLIVAAVVVLALAINYAEWREQKDRQR